MPRTKPHTKVHVSVAHHPKTQEVWADPFQRGMLVEVWRLGMERYAGKRGDILSIRPPDRLSITGADSLDAADLLLITLFADLKYKVRKYQNRWDVHIRNYAEKHGFRVEESDTFGEKNPTHKKEERREKKEQEERIVAKRPPSTPKKLKPSEDPRVLEAWPLIQAAFAEHGKALGESAGTRAPLILKRIEDDGATTEDLVAAVHGYVAFHGGLTKRDGDSFDPGQYFRPTTVFKSEGFSDKVDAGKTPRAVGGLSKWDRILSR